MTITIETQGRRHYLRGETYPLRAAIREAGGKWDPDAGAWWTGKRDVAEQIAASAAATTSNPPAKAPGSDRGTRGDKVSDETVILARVTYRGRPALLLWEGTTSRGRGAKLASMDGARVFWADATEVTIVKEYARGGDNGRSHPRGSWGRRQARSEQPMTFGRLNAFREEMKAERAIPSLVGAEAEYTVQFHASKRDRTPQRNVGDLAWLKVESARIAVVVTGYAPAQYVKRDDAEDMGHYDMDSGYYGSLYYRAATVEEWAALQAKDPREDGSCLEAVRAVVQALNGLGARCAKVSS